MRKSLFFATASIIVSFPAVPALLSTDAQAVANPSMASVVNAPKAVGTELTGRWWRPRPTTTTPSSTVSVTATPTSSGTVTSTPTNTATSTGTSTSSSTPTNTSTAPAVNSATLGGVFLQGDGLVPSGSNGLSTYDIAAKASPNRVSRSEVWWAQDSSGKPLKIVAGDRLISTFTITPKLGDSPMDDSGWIVVAQAHGPVGSPTAPSWIEPEWALSIRNGAWRLVGGDWGRGNQWYKLNLLRYTDGQPVNVKLDVVHKPVGGTVKLWLNGVLVVDLPSINTMYADNWDGLRFRTGLYAGEQGTAVAPTYARRIQVSNLVVNLSKA